MKDNSVNWKANKKQNPEAVDREEIWTDITVGVHSMKTWTY